MLIVPHQRNRGSPALAGPPHKMMFNLLSTPLIRAEVGGVLRPLTLPEAIAALMCDEVAEFPALRPHQRAAWHMFLTQLCAIALHRAGAHEIPADAKDWSVRLLDLTDGATEPWSLVVADLSKPAFLQPPVPEGNLAALKNTIPTPDALDVLITAKNFDLKSAVAEQAQPDDWLFALISLQTMEGFLGAGNYGIARMNGGFSARPFLGLAPRDGGMGAHLRRDIRAMMAGRGTLVREYEELYDEEGLALVWLEPWDGKSSLRLTRLDPWFIEICRRIRFAPECEGFRVLGGGSAAARIAAKEQSGVTGDFWAPVNDAEAKSFSLDARGFSYRVLCRLLFGEGSTRTFRLPPAMKPHPGEADMAVVARGVSRGQGKTEGFHQRVIPVRRTFVRALDDDALRDTLGQIADRQQKELKTVTDALKYACQIVGHNGQPLNDVSMKERNRLAALAEPYTRRLEAEAEANFFDALERRLIEGDAAKAPYLRRLIETAQILLAEASEALPCAARMRWRARVRAPAVFRGALWGAKGALVNDRELIFPRKEATDA